MPDVVIICAYCRLPYKSILREQFHVEEETTALLTTPFCIDSFAAMDGSSDYLCVDARKARRFDPKAISFAYKQDQKDHCPCQLIKRLANA